MNIETRAFNRRTGKMCYFPALMPTNERIVAISPDAEGLRADDPVMIKTTMFTLQGEPVWEGDVCECQVIVQGFLGGMQTMMIERGVMAYRPDLCAFQMHLRTSPMGQQTFQVQARQKLGNIYENPDLMEPLQVLMLSHPGENYGKA